MEYIKYFLIIIFNTIFINNNEIINNIRIDARRYAAQTYANLNNMNGYVTSGIVSMLDGYYNSLPNGGTQIELTLDTETAYVVENTAAELNLKKSGYKWINVSNDNYTVSLTNGVVDDAAAANSGDISVYRQFASNAGKKVKINLPTENGAYVLFVQLVDKAGNYRVYRYEQPIVIDKVEEELVDIKVICNDDQLHNAESAYTDVDTGCIYNTATDSYLYRYKAGNTIKIIASYTRPVASAVTGTMKIGGTSVALENTAAGTMNTQGVMFILVLRASWMACISLMSAAPSLPNKEMPEKMIKVRINAGAELRIKNLM